MYDVILVKVTHGLEEGLDDTRRVNLREASTRRRILGDSIEQLPSGVPLGDDVDEIRVLVAVDHPHDPTMLHPGQQANLPLHMIEPSNLGLVDGLASMDPPRPAMFAFMDDPVLSLAQHPRGDAIVDRDVAKAPRYGAHSSLQFLDARLGQEGGVRGRRR